CRVLFLPPQPLDVVALADRGARAGDDLVLDPRVVERLLNTPAWVPARLHPEVFAAVELDGHVPTIPSVRAVVLNSSGHPEQAQIWEPEGPDVLRVRACGLCGSDVEKIGRAAQGTVLGHEVVAETTEGRRVALVHHQPCGECKQCRAGHESTCAEFGAATIQPGGFAERVTALSGWVELPDDVDDAVGSYAEPLACVLRGAERVPEGDVLVLGGGFVGRLVEAVLAKRGDTVYVHDIDPVRSGPKPPGPVRPVRV